jgi:hypothetical protein
MADAYNPHFPRFGGAKAPEIDIQSPLKRMRRDPHSNVSFEADVKVCVVNNVDVRKNVSTRPVTTWALPQSILRTAAIEDFENRGPAQPNIIVTTKRKIEKMNLKPEGTEPRRQKKFKRCHSTYSPGSWACSSGCKFIDATGAGSHLQILRVTARTWTLMPTTWTPWKSRF